MLAIKVPNDLAEKLQAFIDDADGTYTSVGEAVKTLLVRGLFLVEKPSGSVSEAAFDSAFLASKGMILDVAQRKLGTKLGSIMDEVYQELQSRQGRGVV